MEDRKEWNALRALPVDGCPPSAGLGSEPNSHSKGVTFDNPSFVCDIEDAKDIRPEEGAGKGPSEKNGPPGLPSKWLPRVQKRTKLFVKVALFVLYNVYLAFAVHISWDRSVTWCEGPKFLLLITALAYLFALHALLVRHHLLRKARCLMGPLRTLGAYKHTSKLMWCAVLASFLAFLIVDTRGNRYRLVSAGGLTVLVLLGYIFSKHRAHIVWRHLFWGLSLQFCLGLLVLRWSVGREAVACLGDKVTTFLGVTDSGSTFVFGYLVSGQMEGTPAQPAVFAFKVLSVVIFFSFVVSLLYYCGAMQVAVEKVGWLLQETVGTTPCESMNAAGNIFLGMTEAPLLIRPYLPRMTRSELHAVMTGGFATIAGSVLAAYINFGINASHLLSSSVMAAPVALSFAKLVYPETEVSRTKADGIQLEKGRESNALEAATNGASAAISLVSNIAANLVAFVAFVALVDTFLGWMGSMVAFNQLSFQWLLSKLFVPVSLLMGVDWEDREVVANLIGLKTVVNEFVAYKKLAEDSGQHRLSARSEAIATFALCGFSNISSIGIQVGALSAMAPDRKSDLSQIAPRAMIAGTVTCFLNACVAGMLLQE